MEPDLELEFTYPLERLWAKPTVVLNFLDGQTGVPAPVLFDSLCELFEACLEEHGRENFRSKLAKFLFFEGGFTLTFDTGERIIMKESPTGVFRSGEEVSVSFHTHQMIMEALREALPESWKEDFSIEEVPLPGNNFLHNPSQDGFKGVVQRMSSPEEKLNFRITYLSDGSDDYKVELW